MSSAATCVTQLDLLIDHNYDHRHYVRLTRVCVCSSACDYQIKITFEDVLNGTLPERDWNQRERERHHINTIMSLPAQILVQVELLFQFNQLGVRVRRS